MSKSLLGLGLIGIAGAATFAVLPSAPAQATDGGGNCGGRLIEYKPVVVDGQKVGQLQLYYNAAAGTNCAVMMHGGPTWGVLRDTGVLLAKAPNRNGNYRQAAYQRKNFRYQAGPIKTNGENQCVYAGGGIDHKGKHHTVYTEPHCG